MWVISFLKSWGLASHEPASTYALSALPVGKASGRKTGQTSYVLCHQPKFFDWRLRKAKIHPLGTLAGTLFVQVCERLNQIIQVG